MLNTDNPKNLLKFITLPQCLILALLAGIFIHTGEAPTGELIAVFVCELVINVAVIIYYMHSKNSRLHIRWIYGFFAAFSVIFPWGVFVLFTEYASISVASPETLYLFGNSISLIYLAWVILKNNSQGKNPNPNSLLALCLIVPITIFVLLQNRSSIMDFTLVLAIGLLCIFLYLLSRLGFMGLEKFKSSEPTNDNGYSSNYRVLVAVAAILLPQAGLLVNEYFLRGGGGSDGLLGNFSSPWFHVVAALNGLLLLLDSRKGGLLLFYLKSLGFGFISYFTLIFIPYMPYAVLGILVFGLGLLVYVPAVVFVIQFKQLRRDYRFLSASYQKSVIILIALIGFLTLPALLALNFSLDRINFKNALSYVEVSVNSQRSVDFYRLKRSIKEINATMNSPLRQSGLTLMPGTPLISTAYRYIALGNMFFTEDTLSKLQMVFTPEEVVGLSETMWSEPEPNKNYSTKLSVSQTEYDSKSGVYKTWIDFEVTQLNGNQFDEYRTEFTLPDGCFITDYYLYVEGEKKRGIITDKRAAQVAYESIIRTPRDPGIIYYKNDNTISLRVYPFSRNETRKTGFQIMYSQNEALVIEGQSVNLVAEVPLREPIIMEGLEFIPMEYKKELPVMEREPIYYFLLDAGEDAPYLSHLEKAKRYSLEKGVESRYYAVSYQTGEITDTDSLKPVVQAKGGFNTAYAMSEIFSSVPPGYFPVILLVTENINRATALEKIRLTPPPPETDWYYRLNEDFSLTPYSFQNSERHKSVSDISISKAINYNQTAINGENNEVIITDSEFARLTGEQYVDAFLLQKNSVLADSNDFSHMQVSFIKEAIGRRILTKHTSFIVMETKEQEDLLLSLQKQFLDGKSAQTPSVMMSEPGWWLIALMILVGVFKFRLIRIDL